MKRSLLILAVASVLVFGITAYAHHSIGATYDGNKEVKLVGKLVQFDFRNPAPYHSNRADY